MHQVKSYTATRACCVGFVSVRVRVRVLVESTVPGADGQRLGASSNQTFTTNSITFYLYIY